MFNIFIDPNIKAERTQFHDGNVLFLSIMLGSFADAVQVFFGTSALIEAPRREAV